MNLSPLLYALAFPLVANEPRALKSLAYHHPWHDAGSILQGQRGNPWQGRNHAISLAYAASLQQNVG